MKLIHLSDLHIGKRVNEFSMIEDQQYILTEILNIVDEEQPDGVLIAGDVYDKSIPSEDAVHLLDDFLTKLARKNLQVYMISGNHDSSVKLSFASNLIDKAGVHIAPVYDGRVEPYTLEDKVGNVVKLYLLPFIKPLHVRTVFPEAEIGDYSDACAYAIAHMEMDPKACNILVAHQFVTGAERSESEEISVGGLDDVSVEVFDDFDYVALGHIHGPQRVGRDTVRYSGTPLKYSFSEANHHKSVTVLEIEGKEVGIRTVELKPLRDMRIIRGSYEEVTSKKNYEGTNTEDYVQIVLTDEEDIVDAMGKLRVIYPNLMKLLYDNTRTRENREISSFVDVERKQPIELFDEFFESMNNQPMTQEQRDFTKDLIDKIWG